MALKWALEPSRKIFCASRSWCAMREPYCFVPHLFENPGSAPVFLYLHSLLWTSGTLGYSPHSVWICCLFLYFVSMDQTNMRAVFTGIKKPEFFSHSVFLLEVARQLPLNTAKYPNKKTHLWSVVFWNSAGFSLFFFANVNARYPLAGIIQVFGHVARDLPTADHPRPATYCALRTVKGREKSRMRTSYQKNSVRFRFFRACAFLAKNPKSYGFFWQCKWYNKKPRFFGFWCLPM